VSRRCRFVDRLRAWLTPAPTYVVKTLYAAHALGPAALNLTVGGISGTSVVLTDRGHFGFPVSARNWFENTITWQNPTDASSHPQILDALITAMARGVGAPIFDE
jgi:hypothetical protein